MVLKFLFMALGFLWCVGSLFLLLVDLRLLLILADFNTLLTFVDLRALPGKLFAGYPNCIRVSVVFFVRRCGNLIAISDGIESNYTSDSYYARAEIALMHAYLC